MGSVGFFDDRRIHAQSTKTPANSAQEDIKRIKFVVLHSVALPYLRLLLVQVILILRPISARVEIGGAPRPVSAAHAF